MVRRTLYWAGGEVLGAKQGTDLSPSSPRPRVLRAHIKQEPCFFDTSPLHLGLKAIYNSGSRIIGGSTVFEDPSTWPPSKLLLLFITSLCYYWYLMLLFLHYSRTSDLCHEPGPYSIRCCTTPREKKSSTCPQSSQAKYSTALWPFPFIQSPVFILDSACKFMFKDWVFLIRIQVPPVTTRNDFSNITSLLTAMPSGAQPRSPTAEQVLWNE